MNEQESQNDIFKIFVDSAPVLCLSSDKNFITTYVNPYYEKIHNITLKDAVGKHIKEIIGEEGFIDNLDYYNKVLNGEIVQREASFNKMDGETHYYRATYSPIIREGKVDGISGVVLDITAEKKLELIATMDYLTNIYNRRSIDALLLQEVKKFQRYQIPLSLMIMDIDNFKSINDIFGHLQGDEVLKIISKEISKSIRETDYFGRWGGEEFIVIMPHTSGNDALILANKLRDILFNYKYDFIDKVTCSFGVVECDKNMKIEEYLEYADKSLYKAKHEGKNQSILYSH